MTSPRLSAGRRAWSRSGRCAMHGRVHLKDQDGEQHRNTVDITRIMRDPRDGGWHLPVSVICGGKNATTTGPASSPRSYTRAAAGISKTGSRRLPARRLGVPEQGFLSPPRSETAPHSTPRASHGRRRRTWGSSSTPDRSPQRRPAIVGRSATVAAGVRRRSCPMGDHRPSVDTGPVWGSDRPRRAPTGPDGRLPEASAPAAHLRHADHR